MVWKGKKRVLVGLEAQVNRPTDRPTTTDPAGNLRTGKEGNDRKERTKTWEHGNVTRKRYGKPVIRV